MREVKSSDFAIIDTSVQELDGTVLHPFLHNAKKFYDCHMDLKSC